MTHPRLRFSMPRFSAGRSPAEPGVAILASGAGYGEEHRFSLVGIDPVATFEVVEGVWSLRGEWPGRVPAASAGPWEALREVLRQTHRPMESDIEGPIFRGGWIGHLGYEIGWLIEDLPPLPARVGNVPDLSLRYYDTFAMHDACDQETEVWAADRAAGADAISRAERLRDLLTSEPAVDEQRARLVGPLTSDRSEAEYRASVERVLEYLRAGDIFQANLSHEFSGQLRGSSESILARAMEQSPAPFSAFLRGKGWEIISNSPERFLLVRPDGRVETRPIKGTRPRGRDPHQDLLLKEDLARSEKDDAELTMIVDLERNDLGRVCRYGSVQVKGHRTIETYPNVLHAVSTVVGQLRPGMDLVDLLIATFPGGSITGAPKVRAMQIIHELERSRRGVYTGAIGYISDHGRADFNVAIRTMTIEGSLVRYRVGGGIVIDSDPMLEYRETLVKGQKLRSILSGEGA